jgi:hypothetical protein
MPENTNDRLDGILDICLALFLFLICGMTFFEAGKLPESHFEPLGPSFLPLWVAGFIMALALIVFIRGFRILAIEKNRSDKPSSPIITPMAFYFIGLSVLYILSMYYNFLGYRLASIIYITVLGSILKKFKLKGLIISLLVAFISTFTTYYIFTRILIISLP